MGKVPSLAGWSASGKQAIVVLISRSNSERVYRRYSGTVSYDVRILRTHADERRAPRRSRTFPNRSAARLSDHCPKTRAARNAPCAGDPETMLFVETQVSFSKSLDITGQAIRVCSRQSRIEQSRLDRALSFRGRHGQRQDIPMGFTEQPVMDTFDTVDQL